jgi:alkylation response protein AidB-like acyl-CoA dehydrogenase
MLEHRTIYSEDYAIFRDTVRRFVAAEIAPNFSRWEEQGIVDRDYWTKGGAAGLPVPSNTGAVRRLGR